MTADERGAVFALLDDCDASAARRSRLVVRASCMSACARTPRSSKPSARPRHRTRGSVCMPSCSPTMNSAGIFSTGNRVRRSKRSMAMPRCVFCSSNVAKNCSRDEVDAWLVSEDGGLAERVGGGTATVREDASSSCSSTRRSGAIHSALHAGDSYQVNYTYRLGFDVFGSAPSRCIGG